MNQKEEELKSALEYQIDIVLRLEEERLRLLKETKLQKEKIRELTVRCETSTIKSVTKTDSEVQCEKPYTKESETQTQSDQKNDETTPNQSAKKTERNLLDEANALISKYAAADSVNSTITTEKTSKVNTSIKQKQPKVAVKSLKFVSNKENTDRGNSAYDEVTQKNQNLRNEKEVLAQEIINLNREINRLKIEGRIAHENIKKVERENVELRKTLELKSEMLDKYKEENTEMGAVINSDKFKSIKTIEGELKKALGHNKELVAELSARNNEKFVLEGELKHFKEVLQGLKTEYEKVKTNDTNVRDIMLQLSKKDERLQDLESKLKFKEDEADSKQKTINELIHDNDNLTSQIEYFKGMAKNSKNHAEKALADVEVYRKMLQNKSVSQSDVLSLSQTMD